ncbi:MAG: hypothetical protein MJ125_01190 [Clostridia bacterium]|nr:hypothetical protein [Clostridia bacterium]
MKLFAKILALFTSIIFALSGVSESAVGYTPGNPINATRQDYCFDNDKLLIGAYYADYDKLQLAKEAGIEFFIDSSVTEEALDLCQQYGIGIIAGGYNLSRGYGDFTENEERRWSDFDISEYKDHPALWGDDMIDEPGANSFPGIGKAASAYYEKTEGKIALINLFPNYASVDQLNETNEMSIWAKIMLLTSNAGNDYSIRYKKYISDYVNNIDTDYICLDYYPMRAKLDSKGNTIKYTDSKWLRNLDEVADACKRTNRDFWIITQAAGMTLTEEESDNPRHCDTFADISQQAFASMCFGAKAIIHAEFAAKGWWDPETSHMIDKNGNTTDTYDAVKKTDSYIAPFAKEYGNYKYTSTYCINPMKVAGLDLGKLICDDADEHLDISTKNGLLVGTFTGDEGKAYVITNMEELNDEVTAAAVLNVPEGKTITVYQRGKAYTYSGIEKYHLTLQPGEGVYITIK